MSTSVITWQVPVDETVYAPTRTNWDMVLDDLKDSRGCWGVVLLYPDAERKAAQNMASWLRSRRFKTVRGFEARTGMTSFGQLGVFARVR